jgi:hypothetical protein
MAVNDSRSMNQDLKLGARDGAFKSLTPDRGGEVDTSHATYRMNSLQSAFPTGEMYSIEARPSIADLSDGLFH